MYTHIITLPCSFLHHSHCYLLVIYLFYFIFFFFIHCPPAYVFILYIFYFFSFFFFGESLLHLPNNIGESNECYLYNDFVRLFSLIIVYVRPREQHAIPFYLLDRLSLSGQIIKATTGQSTENQQDMDAEEWCKGKSGKTGAAFCVYIYIFFYTHIMYISIYIFMVYM